jgi:N12 class adenine-specific DNA methylase/adenine-specific DNA methylase
VNGGTPLDKLSEFKILLQAAQQKVTSSAQEWKAFLRFAAQIYKYDFTSALMIYTQRPDATALAPIETWNRVGRRVNTGAHGIPTIIKDGHRLTLKFLFDVSDTNGEEKTLPVNWQLKNEYQETVLIDLEERYNIHTQEQSFEARLAKIIDTYIEHNIQDYYNEMIENCNINDSIFSNLEASTKNEDVWTFDDAKEVIKNLLTDNVTYMIFDRVLDTGSIADSVNFMDGAILQEPMVLKCIGNASINFSCALLRQIESSVKQIEHELQKQQRGLKHGISGRERPVISGIGDSRTAGRGTVDEIRNEIHEISGRGTSGEVLSSDDRSGTDGGLPSGGTGSERVRGRADQAASEKATGAEDGQPYGIDSVQQLAVQDSRGNDVGGCGVPEEIIIEKQDELFTEKGSVGFRLLPTDEENPNYTSFISEFDFLNSYLFPALKNDTIFSNRTEIYHAYTNDPTAHEAINYLKDLFPAQKSITLQINDSHACVWYDSKKIHFAIALPDGDYSRTVNWPTCEKYIRQLIDDGNYIEDMPPRNPQQLSLGSFVSASSEIEQSQHHAEPTSQSSTTENGPIIESELEPAEKSGTSSAFFIEPTQQINYHYPNTEEFSGGQKTHYKANVEAIRLLKSIESEQRLATSQEQPVLAKYVGWGGIPQGFDKNNVNWQTEFTQLKELLSDDEYIAARASTLTAFYTPPAVISAVHTALNNFGFTGGNVLEPSCGTGRFFGYIPENLSRSCKLYGVELDSVTGRIARQLNQSADIQVKGFEKTTFPDNFFDIAVGNVPFGQFGVPDTRYDKNNFLIHDYFFAKTLDTVRPGGIIAFVTSKGTLDKANPEVRRYIARRAELIGAVRFPNTMMYSEANTKVTSDLIFLQKRDHMVDIEPDWVNLTYLDGGIPVNTYFADHPEMMLGDMVFDEGMYGNAKDTALLPHKGKNWREELIPAINSLHWKISEPKIEVEDNEIANTIPADPNVKNYTYTIKEGKLYYRENAQMILQQNITGMREIRIRGMIKIRDTLRDVIRAQSENHPESEIQKKQAELNVLYDDFTYKYGYLTKSGNKLAFSDDSDYPLLTSLENVDDDENVSKADIFTKRTIRPPVVMTKCDTSVEALPHCLDMKGCVDIGYISGLTEKSEEQVLFDLKSLIYRNPETGQFETADEYLSGNVREKLAFAETATQNDSQYAANVEALKIVQPTDLDASQIDVRLGSPLIDTDDVKQFIVDILKPSAYDASHMKINYIPSQALWKISGIYHAGQLHNILSGKTYGTRRIDAYELIEISLNQKTPTIRDKQPDDSYRMNPLETAAAREKQRVIEHKFEEWVFGDPQRRKRLVWKYNQTYNNTRIRKFDGSYLTFPGMTPEIILDTHQKNAAARILQTGNTLIAHCVGAGKTYTMIAAAMESKRLGLCSKSMMVVPGHLIDQWGADILKLYPGANVLLATKKDFEKNNRQRLISRIATGDYAIIVIAQSSFEKIPISPDRIERLLHKQINDIVSSIELAKEEDGKDWTVKAMERTKKGLEEQLEKLLNQSRKDDLLTFEQLGVDQIFVDEAHYYKNLFVATKMVNVAGIGQQKAQKASDMLMKCRYINELHNWQFPATNFTSKRTTRCPLATRRGIH